MTSTDYQEAHHQGAVDKPLAPRFGGPGPKPISSNRFLGSLKEAANWPGAHPNAVVILALSLVAARADAEGSSYFKDLSERNPANATTLALAGFFAMRAGDDLAAAVTKLDNATIMEPGLPHYFRGLALAELLPDGGPPEAAVAAVDIERANQVIADLEFVLAARDQFPVLLLRAVHQGLARAYRVLGREQQAAEALRRSGVGPVATDRLPTFTGFWLTARDGLRLSAPGTLSPAPNVHVAQSYDFSDFAFIDKRGSRRHRRWNQPGPRAGRNGRSWPRGSGACQSPHPHARSLRPHRRRRGRVWPCHRGDRLRSIPC
jgi:hypothetical protein